MRARLLAVSAVAALAAAALPAHAAAAKSKTLFFDNAGTADASGCSTVYVLQLAEPSGPACSGLTVGAAGNGSLGKESFMTIKKAVGYKASSAKHVTGTVYITQYPAVSASVSPSNTVPGYVGAKITISINGVPLGTVAKSGPVAGVNATLAIPVDLAVPRSLNGKVVKTVTADIVFTDGQGLVNVAYFQGAESKLSIPTL